MKTYLLPLSLRLARAAARPALLFVPILAGASLVRAQDAAPRILFPAPNQDVRGEISVRFENIPAGGYAIIKINGQFKTASAQESYVLDTIGDRVTFPDDGSYTVEITAMNAGGRAVGTSSVSFNVANQKVAGTSQAVRLVHWTPQDRLHDGVQRYRVFAESNADITEPSSGGGAGGGGLAGGGGAMAGGGGGDAGGSGGGTSYLPAPLDWQVAILMRREVRDVYGFEGSANIATQVSQAQQHQREGSGGSAGGLSAGGGAPPSTGHKGRGAAASSGAAAKVKGPWMATWTQGPEVGKFYVKAIKPTGDEINATRKVTSIAIADLLPTFPTVPVRPGSTWQSRQSFLSDLSTREPIYTQGAITFTAYDNIQTPDGQIRRCAKLESRFPLPDNVAKEIAAKLGSKVGSGGGGGGGGALGGGLSGGSMLGGGGDAAGGAGASELTAEDIDVATFNIARVIWFDMDKHQVVRSEDTLTAYFEVPPASSGAGAGGALGGGPSMGGEAGGAGSAPAEPTKVNYRMNVTTWLDDRLPAPSIPFNGGAGTAHSRDNVKDVDLTRATARR